MKSNQDISRIRRFIQMRDYSKAKGMLATRILHRCWWILKAWSRNPERSESVKSVARGMLRRQCTIWYIYVRSTWILLRTKDKNRSHLKAVSYGTWCSPFKIFVSGFWTFSIKLRSTQFPCAHQQHQRSDSIHSGKRKWKWRTALPRLPYQEKPRRHAGHNSV